MLRRSIFAATGLAVAFCLSGCVIKSEGRRGVVTSTHTTRVYNVKQRPYQHDHHREPVHTTDDDGPAHHRGYHNDNGLHLGQYKHDRPVEPDEPEFYGPPQTRHEHDDADTSKDEDHDNGKGKGHDKDKGKGHDKGKGKGHDKDDKD